MSYVEAYINSDKTRDRYVATLTVLSRRGRRCEVRLHWSAGRRRVLEVVGEAGQQRRTRARARVVGGLAQGLRQGSVFGRNKKECNKNRFFQKKIDEIISKFATSSFYKN